MDQDVNKLSRSDLEVQSRRMESELAVLRNRAAANPDAFKKDVDKRTRNYQKIQKRIRELDEGEVEVDPEGTSQTLADAEGNYASDVRTARVGGVGARDSNTNPDEVVRRQRSRLKEAGVENADEVPENQLAGVDGSASNVDDSDDGDKSKTADDKSKGSSPRQRPQADK